MVQKIADHDLCAPVAKRLGAFVFFVDHRADGVAFFKQMPHRVASRLAGSAGHQ